MTEQQTLDFTASADIIEARQLVGDLAGVFDHLKIQDQRYVTSWRLLLDRGGNVGTKRLVWLRALHAEKFGQEERRAA